MLKENKEMFDLCNITQWQKDNLGEGTTIVLLDERDTPYDYMKHVVEVPFKGKGITGHISGVGAVGYQIAPKARIIYMPFNESDIDIKNEMIDWIIKHKDEIDVINVSIGFSIFVARRYFPQLEATEIPIVCAAGNESKEDGIAHPASYPFTIAVGSYSPNMKGYATYSNRGKELDCIADAGTYYPNPDDGRLVSQFGTSFSSPFVAFSLALYCSWRRRNKLPKLTNDMARQLIKENAKDLYEEGHDFKSGFGLFRLPNEIPQIDKPIVESPKEEEKMARFTDTEKHWAKDAIEFVADKGLMKGYEEGEPGPKDDTFRPNTSLTRAEFATVLARMNGYVEKK